MQEITLSSKSELRQWEELCLEEFHVLGLIPSSRPRADFVLFNDNLGKIFFDIFSNSPPPDRSTQFLGFAGKTMATSIVNPLTGIAKFFSGSLSLMQEARNNFEKMEKILQSSPFLSDEDIRIFFNFYQHHTIFNFSENLVVFKSHFWEQ